MHRFVAAEPPQTYAFFRFQGNALNVAIALLRRPVARRSRQIVYTGDTDICRAR
jgi:hypothetical protein